MSHPINKTWICKECVFVFTIHSPTSLHVPNCPNCADHISVRRYQKPKGKNYHLWTEEELKLVDKVINGEMLIYQAAIKLGRTGKSVARRVARRLEELNKS